MYYFKVPVFTKLNRTQNLVILIFQFFILITSVLISLYRGCSYETSIFEDDCLEFTIFPGTTMITNRTYTSWQFLKHQKYSSELTSKLYDIKYYNIINTTLNGYLLIKGNMMMFDKNNDNYISIFKEYLDDIHYSDFIYYFKETVNMRNEIYKLALKGNKMEFLFWNNCTNNNLLYESKEGCIFKDNIYEEINSFLNNYFNEIFIVPYSCHSCYRNGINNFYEAINVFSKCISIFFMFNSLLIIIYIFIISKIKKSDIGYIYNVINFDINSNDSNDVTELIKIENK